MFKYFKNKIFRQQFLTNFIIIIVTFSSISLILLMFTWHSLEKQQLQIADSYRKTAAAYINGWLNNKELSLKAQAFFLETLEENKLKTLELQDILLQQISSDQSFEELLIIDEYGNIINSGNNIIPRFNWAKLPFFKEVVHGRSIITGLFRTPNNNQRLMICEPIYYRDRPSYLLVGVISLDSFAAIIDDLNFGIIGQVYLVNREGQLLTRAAEINYYTAGFSSKHSFTLVNSYAVQQILQKKYGKGIYKDFALRKVLGSFEWVESLQAGLIVEFFDYKVMQPLYRLFRVIVFLAIGVVFLGLLMAYSISRRTTKHLNELVKAASHIANQDYQYPLALKTNTEFDILINQFNQMQTAIKAREKSLEEKNLELKIQRAEALEATKMKSQFLANMSHELRTPLNSIIGFTSRVIKKCGALLPQVQLENLRIVRSEAQNLLDLINDLLDFSKLEAGRMEVNIDEFNLIEEIREVTNIIQPLQESKSLGYVQDLYRNDVIPITSDRVKVRQILINLLSNALKYSEKGTIILAVKVEDNFYKISVTDEGIGISADDIGKIFDEFRQIDGSYTRKVGGTGLGLSITRKFVEMLQGRIEVSSALGKGSKFTVFLPIHFDMPNTVTEQIDASVLPTTVTQLKVVCIDDDLNVCRLYKQYLEEEGFEVITFYGQEDVVAKIAAIKPDIVLLDIILPQKDGWEILAELKTLNDTREIPVIMVSILSEKDLAYKLKADEYLVKPVTQEELTLAISRLLPTKHYPEVLVADDDVNYLNLISQFLVEEPINFRLARDGEETLRMIDDKKPDLLLLDIMMPKKNGLEVLEEIQKRADLDGIAIIMVTSKSLTKDEISGLKKRVLQIVKKSGTHIETIMDVILSIIKEKTKNGLNFNINGSAKQ